MTRRRLAGPVGRDGVVRELTLFAVLALLMLLLVALGTTVASRRFAADLALERATEHATRLRDLVVAPMLPGVLAGDESALETLHSAVAQRIAEGTLVDVTVWKADGTVVYSDDLALVGSRDAPPAEVVRAAAGASVADFETRPETYRDALVPPGGLAEVYLPLQLPGEAALTFEAYFDYAPVEAHKQEILLRILPLTLVPLLLLGSGQVPLVWSLARRVRAHQQERTRWLRERLLVLEHERRRIAADLHDGPVQDLSGAALVLDAAAVTSEPGELVRSATQVVRRSVASLRALMVDVCPPELTPELVPALAEELAGPLRSRGVRVTIALDLPADLTLDRLAVVHLVVREGLRNVAQHASARRVEVVATTTGSPRTLVVRVCDDGAGGRVDGPRDGHLGLRLLCDRVRAAGGELTLERRDGRTVLAAELGL